MRILHVINNFSLGGAEILLDKMLPLFAGKGINNYVYVFESVDSDLERSVMVRSHVFYSDAGNIYSPRQVFPLYRLLQQQQFDIIHVHLFPAQLWAGIADLLGRTGVPLITTEHSTNNRRRRLLFRPLDAWMYSRYRKIICNSHATETALLDWLPHVREKTEVICNGIETALFSRAVSYDLRAEFSLPDNSFLILSIGRLETEKGFPILLQALAKTRANIFLIIVGDGSLKSDLQRLACALGIESRIRFMGMRDDVARIIKSVNLYVQSSTWEGFGLAAVEAMAGGLPVIVSRVPGLSHVIGDAGLVFNEGDFSQLAAYINQLEANPLKREAMGKASIRQAQNFALTEMVGRYIQVYESLYQREKTDYDSGQ